MCESPVTAQPPCPPPHFRAAHNSCRLFIVVPKACRCGVKYIVQIPVSSASLMLELSPLTLC
ncbi:hypothetical protein E5288_WYG010000 [Bos mutus]|uniref:Uncharacterized protein n=1 Tax=Bos mutus TaxID=72004 RepID=A0A6B0S0G2_9CETA|nr:hypothetical protein [Bos mutus]